MKLSTITLLGATLILGCHSADKQNSTAVPQHNNSNSSTQQSTTNSKIAYVDIDSFEANFEYLKKNRESFAKKQSDMETELKRSAQQMQGDYANLQKKAQEGKMSQSEGEAAQKRLVQMQQSLETRKQTMEEQLSNEQEKFNNKLHQDLADFLDVLNKSNRFEVVLSYSKSSPFMYVKNAQNITQEVIKGMNEKMAK